MRVVLPTSFERADGVCKRRHGARSRQRCMRLDDLMSARIGTHRSHRVPTSNRIWMGLRSPTAVYLHVKTSAATPSSECSSIATLTVIRYSTSWKLRPQKLCARITLFILEDQTIIESCPSEEGCNSFRLISLKHLSSQDPRPKQSRDVRG
jgi:hypothetical protein